MYISELKMHGFKSFAKKEVMKLGEGVTTVVGPNGCGKTNIVDAIRWVLGEQKYSILRSGKMEDVIFNGTESMKPLGVCEVSLTVHNNSGKLPVEYNDIEIARRVYRNGESEYYLNKAQCRLKDINDLFVDTGMGADAYSVIELKMIEQILSESGDDRRRLFEEAAGINKYKQQRKSTLKRFEANHVDLERVSDIMTEVQQKVNGLDLQLKRYKRHAGLKEKFEEDETKLSFLNRFNLLAEIVPMKEKINQYNHLRDEKKSESSDQQDKLNLLREQYDLEDIDLNKYQKELSSLVLERDSLRNSVLVSSEKNRAVILAIDRLKREAQINNKKIADLNQLSLDFGKEISDLGPDIDAQLNKYKTEKEEFDRLDNLYREAGEKLENFQNKRWEIQRKQTDERTLYDRTVAMVDEKKIMCDELNSNIDQKKNLISDLKSDLAQLTNDYSKKSSAINSFISKLEGYRTQEKKLRENRDELLSDINKKTTEKRILDDQLVFYQELIESKEGFPEGTRFVLENPSEFPGILGTIADMFSINSQYRDALEAGLGDLSHCLVAKDKVSALKTLKKARNISAGDLTIIPLKEAKELKNELKSIPNDMEVIGRASDLIETSDELVPLANYLLGNLLIVQDINETKLGNDFSGWTCVDLSGSYSGKDLVLKNRQISEHGNLLGRQEKINSISKMKSGIIEKHDALKISLDLLEVDIKNRRKDIQNHKDIIDSSKKNIIGLESEKIRVAMQIEQLEGDLLSLTEELSNTKNIYKDGNRAIKNLKPKIELAIKDIESSDEKVKKANTDLSKAREERDLSQQNLQDVRVKLVELESKKENVVFKQKSGNESSKELIKRQETIKIEIEQLEKNIEELNQKISDEEEALKKFTSQIQKQKSILDLKQSAHRDTYNQIDDIQQKISIEQKNKEIILEDLKTTELEMARIQQMITLVEEKIMDRYGKKIPDKMVVDETTQELEFSIQKIQRSLDRIGPVNMAVQEEYNEENKRLALLQSQLDDLLESEQNLRSTINKIDRIARKRFQQTFDLIKSNFESLFKLFFEGGNATLTLNGDPDPLEAEIGIEAQPPGKRNSSLRLLSSGEKALTAISLLFSIYQVKPSPYCILDEVDAPLDDVNIRKFTKVLSKFSDETQFIIVTHNKLTMEIADYMYGVTQEYKGISKLVSVKFD
ncbi:MAG: chromosome segregation protein SMC [Candidatus Marinimicrobia bacterium]|nr:chromosome segregation protein SMC [Candidatus Neomarinimicrobiota bacterium]